MNPTEEIKKQYEKDATNLFLEDMKQLLHNYYREELSRGIKKGIAAKRRENELSK